MIEWLIFFYHRSCVYILSEIIESYLFAQLMIFECFELNWRDCFNILATRILHTTQCIFLRQKLNNLPHVDQCPCLFTHTVTCTHGAYLTHVHIPMNSFSSHSLVSIPWCTIMEPPGGLWFAGITEHPPEMVARFLLLSFSGGCIVETHFRVVSGFFFLQMIILTFIQYGKEAEKKKVGPNNFQVFF